MTKQNSFKKLVLGIGCVWRFRLTPNWLFPSASILTGTFFATSYCQVALVIDGCIETDKIFGVCYFSCLCTYGKILELVSKELNHFGVIAGLFRQIGGHSSRFVLFCSFWRLFTIKMIKSVKVFPFSFWKIITKKNLRHEIQTPGKNMQKGRQVI